jgi:hypothetical protein
MNKPCKTEEEAKEMLATRADVSPGFCPLIKDECDNRCVCFKPAQIYQSKGGLYYVYDSYCDNAMFTGARHKE